VGFLFRSLIQLWMFLTCVVYQLEPVAAWKRVVIQLNPMTPIIRAYRDCLLLGRNPLDGPFLLAAAVSVLILAGGWVRFSQREIDFAEHI
jgi:ABC-type polysaccharide/polyol phosphate export permease